MSDFEFNAPPKQFSWALPGQLAVLASSPIAGRAVGSASILSGRVPEFFSNDLPAYAFAYGLKGVSTIECKRGDRVSSFIARPGHFSITPGWGTSQVRSVANMETVNIGISADHLNHILEREFSVVRPGLELVETYCKLHNEISNLGQAFASLLRSPRSGGGLYSESLWTQIALQLIWNFSSSPNLATPRYEKLSDVRVQRVVDYIESSFSEEISLDVLAGIAGLTPNYFLNAFKKATGKTPHHYLRDVRMARACEMLANPQLSILAVALATGYTSQSHFTTVFSKTMGLSPARFRTKALGLKSP